MLSAPAFRCSHAIVMALAVTSLPGLAAEFNMDITAAGIRPGRGRRSTRPGANGVVELTPCEFLDRLAVLVPPPRKHRHRYQGVFAWTHKLRRAVTALAKRQRQQATGGHDRRAWERRSRHGGLL
jgi:hypothetical protein